MAVMMPARKAMPNHDPSYDGAKDAMDNYYNEAD